jgi:hypothetical protein
VCWDEENTLCTCSRAHCSPLGEGTCCFLNSSQCELLLDLASSCNLLQVVPVGCQFEYGSSAGTALSTELHLVLQACFEWLPCAQATLTHCQGLNNNATQGGAVFLQDQGHADITGCNFTANRAIDSAGAIYARLNSTFNVSATHMDDNVATGGGAVALHDTASGTMTRISCAGNMADVDGGCIRMDSSQVSPS